MIGSTAVREIRRQSKLSLRSLAAIAGTSPATISAYEHGRISPTTATVERLAAAAGLQILVRIEPRIPALTMTKGEELELVLSLVDSYPRWKVGPAPTVVFPRT